MKTAKELDALIDNDKTLSSLYQRIQPKLSKDPGHDLAHALRVALWTLHIGESLDQYDQPNAIAAALCRDEA